MSDDSEQVGQMIRDGEYFDESRRWYQTIYIGPVSERTFFLIIALLAGMVALFSIIGFIEFLPITDRPAILIRNARFEETVPVLSHINPNRAPVNQAMMRFFVKTYIESREGYDSLGYVDNFNFIHAHSDAPTYDAYTQIYGSNNPQSPAAILGDNGERLVTIESMTVNDKVDPHVATVGFVTELTGTESANTTRWTATLQFYYSNLVATDTIDPNTHKHVLNTQDPQFQVVSYALSQAP